MAYLLVSDFDGTFAKGNLKKSIQATIQFRKRGNLFVIATGRSYPGIITILKEKQIPYDYLICNDGGKIFDQAGNEIYSTTFSQENGKKILEFLTKDVEIELVQTDSGYHYGKQIEDGICTIRAFPKVPNNAKKLLKLQTLFPHNHVYLSAKSFHFLPKKSGKKSAILILSTKLNLKEEQIYTIGDSDNDFEMIQGFQGNTIKGSSLQQEYPEFPQFDDVASLIEQIEKENVK